MEDSQYGCPPRPYTYWLEISCIPARNFLFHFQNNLVLTNKDEEVSSADTLPLRLSELKDLCLSLALAIPEWFDWTRVAWLPLLVKISR